MELSKTFLAALVLIAAVASCRAFAESPDQTGFTSDFEDGTLAG